MKILFPCVVATLAVVAGCVSQPPPRTAALSPAVRKLIAYDSVSQLAKTFPPAKTALWLGKDGPPAFDRQLGRLLRAKGFALREVPAALEKKPNRDGEYRLRYSFGELDNNRLWISLTVDKLTISRAYEKAGGLVHPAGQWASRHD